MSTKQQHNRDRGRLFENDEKRKPSHPDLRGDCAIGGVTYEMQAWRRNEQISLTLAPARGKRNTYPPDAFKGSLDRAPRPGARGNDGGAEAPAWIGDVVGDEETYTVRAFDKQGKSGNYLALFFVSSDPS